MIVNPIVYDFGKLDLNVLVVYELLCCLYSFPNRNARVPDFNKPLSRTAFR